MKSTAEKYRQIWTNFWLWQVSAEKTANVVRGNLWQKPGVVVDTHVKRITKRIGLTVNTDPEKVERDLEKLIKGEKTLRMVS